MSWNYVKHTWLAQFTGDISEEEMKDIPYPVVELGVHVTQRFAEVRM